MKHFFTEEEMSFLAELRNLMRKYQIDFESEQDDWGGRYWFSGKNINLPVLPGLENQDEYLENKVEF